MAAEQGKLQSVCLIPGRYPGCSEKCCCGMLLGRREQSQIPQRCCGIGAGNGHGEELRRPPPIPLAKAGQGGVISLAATFQNSELTPQTLTVNRVCLHDAVHSTEAETWTVQIPAVLRGVKHRQIFPGAQPAAAVSSDGLAQVQRSGKKKPKGFVNKHNPGNKTPTLFWGAED